VARLYEQTINSLHDVTTRDKLAMNASKSTAETQALAGGLAEDYQGFLNRLDDIPFPASAKEDLSALKKSAVALQLFWTDVKIDLNNFSQFRSRTLQDAFNQAALVLGHDVGVSLEVNPLPSPTP
jgi:hypothetical protein